MFCFNTVCAGLSTGSCHTLFVPLYSCFGFVFLSLIFFRYVYFDNFFYYSVCLIFIDSILVLVIFIFHYVCLFNEIWNLIITNITSCAMSSLLLISSYQSSVLTFDFHLFLFISISTGLSRSSRERYLVLLNPHSISFF